VEAPLNRGRTLLIAQRKRGRKPLGAAPFLDKSQSQAWAHIVVACPDILSNSDRVFVELAAIMLSGWRSGAQSMESLRLNYRILGKLFMPMAARRRLLFGHRH
jgi:hypothetical protein